MKRFAQTQACRPAGSWATSKCLNNMTNSCCALWVPWSSRVCSVSTPLSKNSRSSRLSTATAPVNTLDPIPPFNFYATGGIALFFEPAPVVSDRFLVWRHEQPEICLECLCITEILTSSRGISSLEHRHCKTKEARLARLHKKKPQSVKRH